LKITGAFIIYDICLQNRVKSCSVIQFAARILSFLNAGECSTCAFVLQAPSASAFGCTAHGESSIVSERIALENRQSIGFLFVVIIGRAGQQHNIRTNACMALFNSLLFAARCLIEVLNTQSFVIDRRALADT
jgi:hypothetical protein